MKFIPESEVVNYEQMDAVRLPTGVACPARFSPGTAQWPQWKWRPPRLAAPESEGLANVSLPVPADVP
jgi:hypothetical protein